MGIGAGVLLDRDEELDVLRSTLSALERHEHAALVFEGDPGIGKSRLLSAAVAIAPGTAQVLSATGSELESLFPFGLVRQLFEPALRSLSSQEQSDLLDGSAAAARRVVGAADPHLAAAFDDLEGDPLSGSAIGEVTNGVSVLLERIAERRPVVLAIDDLQWGDPVSVRWLVHATRRLHGMPVAVIAATRHPGDDPAGRALRRLLALDGVRLHRPGPLSGDAVRRLVADALGESPGDRFTAACLTASGGNPFLLNELLHELARRRVAPDDTAVEMVRETSPRAVLRHVIARLESVSDASRDILHAVAVLGPDADPKLVAELSGRSQHELDMAREELASVAVLAGEDGLRFAHPLIEAAVRESLDLGVRSSAHRRAAWLLRDRGGSVEQVAAHLEHVLPEGEPAVVDALVSAARDAAARADNLTAATHLTRALREPPPPGDELPIMFRLARTELLLGDVEGATRRFAEGLQRDGDRRVRALMGRSLGALLIAQHQYARAAQVLERAAADVPDGEDSLRDDIDASLWTVGAVDLDARRRDNERARGSTSRRFGDLARRAMLELTAGTSERAAGLARDAVGGESGREGIALFHSANMLMSSVLVWSEQLDAAGELLEWVTRSAGRHDAWFALGVGQHLRTLVLERRGDLLAVEQTAAAAPPFTLPFGVSIANVSLAHAHVDRDGPARAREIVEAADLVEATRGTGIATTVHWVQGRIAAADGDHAAALEHLRACGRIEAEWDIRTPSVTRWQPDAVLALRALEYDEEARELAAEAVARARSFGAPGAIGVALRAAGLADRANPDTLADSVEWLERSPLALEQARARIDHGAALRRRNRRAAAREQLSVGLAQAQRCGATVLVQRASEELRRAGVRRRRAREDARFELTPSEQRVADLAAQGMKNREIAQELFVTEKAIELHLSNCYRKLGIRSRGELPDALG